ncbi:MAG: hypothetical protein ABL927_09440 [Bdellovibrionales bacterium]
MRAILLTITFIFSVSSFAENKTPTVVQVRGLVKSMGTHTRQCNVVLEVIDENSGKSLGLVGAAELERLHCDKEQDFVATISGEITSKFLFWGGNLKVSQYEIATEQEAEPHIVAEVARPSFTNTGGGRDR